MRENLWLKVASVLFAVGLWLFVVSKGRDEISVRAQVEVVNVPAGMVLTKHPDEDVIIGLSGNERFLRNIEPGVVGVRLDLSGYKAGDHRYHIGRSDVRIPARLRLTRIDPPSLELSVEQAQRKSIPVRAILAGRAADGYAVTSVEVVPGEVEVLGEKKTLRTLRFIETDSVDISGISANLETKAALDVSKRPYTVAVPEVTVRVLVGKDTGKEN
jgi:YbbR domain-containing protein